ncbi:MAG: endonuclease NucS [Nitrososphaeria archaeon]
MNGIMFYPLLDEACEFINSSVKGKRLIICIGLFSVEYLGRSSSNLGLGERLLIIKEDGSVLIHRRAGYEPVNWQPPGCIIKCNMKNGKLLLLSERRRPKEFLKVTFEKVCLVIATSLVDKACFEMGPIENEFYGLLVAHPEYIEEGLRVISRQKSIASGVPDLLGKDSKGNYVIIEVKRNVAGVDAVRQLDRYIKSQPGHLRGILCAPSITKSALLILKKKGYDFRRLDLKALSSLIPFKPCEETLDRHLDGP